MTNGPGLDRETTRNRLSALLDEKIQILKIMEEKGYLKTPLVRNMPERLVLRAKVDEIEREIEEARDYYTLHLLESLDSESKKLGSLTRWLIGLTIILTILTLALVIMMLT